MNGKKRKKYLVTVNSEAFACSLVTNPAVEELFVSFSEDKPLIDKFADESKHMLTGVVAIPNKPIYRRNDKTGEEYDIVFSAEAIEKMAMDYMRNYRQNEVTLQHQEEADGVYLVEQWIKQDNYRDKSAVIGLSEDLPVGSWIQTYYVDSNDVWQRILSGELRGLSLECALSLQEFESQIDKNDNNMIETNDMKFWDKMKEILNEVFSSTSMIEKKEDIEPIEPEALEAQEPAQEPQPTEEPTVEEPVVEEPKPQEEPKQVEEPKPTETVVEEQPKEEAPKEDTKHLEDLINSLREEINALKDMNNGLSSKVKELEKEPSTKPVNTNAKPSSSDTYSAWREQMAKML